ncbi:NADP-dependent oxidoreductase [Streptomyces sp. NPDC002172]
MVQRWIVPEYGDTSVYTLVDAEVPTPRKGEVTIAVRAAGVNPADIHVGPGDPSRFPVGVGFEAAGVITAVGEDTRIASGAVAVGDEVIAYPVRNAWSAAITVPAADVFAKPANVDFAAAANLLLAGTTATEALDAVGAKPGETVMVHGASGAVGVSVLQQAAARGVRVIGTASAANADLLRGFGAVPVAYGEGLLERVRAAAPHGVDAAVDCVGTDEAVDTSLSLLGGDGARFATIAAIARAHKDGLRALIGVLPESMAYRNGVRQEVIDMAADGTLVVPVAATYSLADAQAAIARLATGHPGGKLALIP